MTARLAFAGGLKLSWHCLKALCEEGWVPHVAFGYDESLKGRSGYCDLGDLCRRYGIAYHRIRDINGALVAEELTAHEIDLFLVWNWSQLVKDPILSLPKIGCLGMHPTKLPLGRGRAPIPWSIIKGLRESAISIFFLTAGVDDGDLVWQEPFEIGDEEDAASLYARLETLHERAVRSFCKLLRRGPLPRTPQDHAQATYWPRRRPQDGIIDWSKTTDEQLRWIRALTDPYPGAFTSLNDARFFFWKASRGFGRGGRGKIIAPGRTGGADVGTADGSIEILIAQREGHDRKPAGDFLKTGEWRIGATFGGGSA